MPEVMVHNSDLCVPIANPETIKLYCQMTTDDIIL